MSKRVKLEDIVRKDKSGNECLPTHILDLIWPIDDDVEPLDVAGKGVRLPPTCTSYFQPCEKVHGRKTCIDFVFHEKPVPGPVPPVPIASSGLFLLTIVILIAVFARLTARYQVVKC